MGGLLVIPIGEPQSVAVTVGAVELACEPEDILLIIHCQKQLFQRFRRELFGEYCLRLKILRCILQDIIHLLFLW